MGKHRKSREQGAGRGPGRRQTALIKIDVQHPAVPSDFYVTVPAQASDALIQREIAYVLGPCPDNARGEWRWRCISPAGPVKTRLITRPPRAPFREVR